MIAFIAIFLAIIYTVPVVQTASELLNNTNHRIQMADLAEDLFVTPVKKHVDAFNALDSITKALGALGNGLQVCSGGDGAPDSSCDATAFIALADEAQVQVKKLRRNVTDYNRHITADRNRFAAKDTLRPYYRTLRRIDQLLDTGITMLGAGEPYTALLPRITSADSAAKAVMRLAGPRSPAAAWPGLTLIALRRIMVGADYLRPYEKEMEKSSVFANAVRPWMRLAYYLVFRDAGDKAIPGKNGWMFYRPDVHYLTRPDIADPRSVIVDPNDVPVKDAVLDTIKSFKRQLDAMGIDLVVVIMPGKPSIYPDMLAPSMQPESAGTFSHSTVFIAQMAEAGITTVDLFTPFAKERRRDRTCGDSLYLRTDTHFRGRAVRIAAAEVAATLRRFQWFSQGGTEYAVDTVMALRSGDIAEMVKLPRVTMPRFNLPFPPESTTCYRVMRIERDDSGKIIDRVPYKDDYRNSQILVLGDSYSRIYQTDEPRSAGWISHLALEIGQPVASLVNDGGASTLVRQMLARKTNLLKGKKAVVWEVVERDLRFGEEGWKDIKLTMQ
jgi:hypothetical protein